jgi:hypothetical protein
MKTNPIRGGRGTIADRNRGQRFKLLQHMEPSSLSSPSWKQLQRDSDMLLRHESLVEREQKLRQQQQQHALTESSQSETTTTTTISTTRGDAPTVGRILAFAIPAISVLLCMPLLSMQDTSSVGLVGGTAQQAALNPAIAVINYSAKLLVSSRSCGMFTFSFNLPQPPRTSRNQESTKRQRMHAYTL